MKYPNDRADGFVHLTDHMGNDYVPDFIRSYDCDCDAGNALRYCRAFMELSKRLINGTLHG